MKSFMDIAREEKQKMIDERLNQENTLKTMQEMDQERKLALEELVRQTLRSLTEMLAYVEVQESNRVMLTKTRKQFQFHVEWDSTWNKWCLVWKEWKEWRDSVLHGTSTEWGRVFCEEDFHDKFGKWLGACLYRESLYG